MSEAKERLNYRQELFAREYLVDLNATKAAIRAGYSAKTAGQIGERLLKNVVIAKKVQRAMDARAKRIDITADAVLQELAKIAFANTLDYVRVLDDGSVVVDMSKATRDQMAALCEVTSEVYLEGSGDAAKEVKRVKFKMADKRGALVDLGRNLKLFTDKTEVTGKDGGSIKISNDERALRIESILAAARARRAKQSDGQ